MRLLSSSARPQASGSTQAPGSIQASAPPQASALTLASFATRVSVWSLALFTLMSLSACVTDAGSWSAPVPLGNGVYSAGTSDAGGYGDGAYQRAIRFCFDQGRQLLRVDSTGAAIPGRMGGEVLFRCVGPGERGWKEPVG